MSKDLSELQGMLEAKLSAITLRASKASIEAAIAVVSDLAIKTPVDTSQALSNWLVTLEEPTEAAIKAHFVGQKGSTQKQSAAKTIANAKAVLANKKAGQPIYLANNVDYIRKLNDFGTRKVSAGFVERSVFIGKKVIKKASGKGAGRG